MTRTLRGTGTSPLAGAGTARWHDPEVPAFDREGDDAERELERFVEAREAAREAIREERDRAAERVGESEAEILDAHRQFLDDPTIEAAVDEAIAAGRSAEAAVEAAFADPIEQFEATGGRTAERADDLRDVRDRLLRVLTDATAAPLDALAEGTVLLAERLAPSDTAQLDPEVVAGIATVGGGRTSHAAIVARSLGLPAVVGVGAALREVPDGATVVVDGTAGEVIVDPDEETVAAVREAAEVTVVDEPVETTDGTPIEVAANVGTIGELAAVADRGADGIGLFRTEFLFLDREAPPGEDDQYAAYREALETFPGERVVVRTLDVGGDKPVAYLDAPEETNPFLGQRGIRRSLGPDADLFETQLRALLRAAADASVVAATDEADGGGTGDGADRSGDGADAASTGTADGRGTLAVMVPMVATVAEVDAVLDRVDEVAAALEAEGVAHERPELGAMVETPAAALAAREIADRLDFLSVGTNDLTQYVMAADRENERVRDLHDPLHPPVLRAIHRTVEAGHAGDAWVGMCGEMAGDPALTELLVGLGLDELSMSAVTVPRVKARVREIEDAAATELAEAAIAAESREEVRAVLADREE